MVKFAENSKFGNWKWKFPYVQIKFSRKPPLDHVDNKVFLVHKCIYFAKSVLDIEL